MLLSKITADDIRCIYTGLLKRSERQATYAMQVMRAVLRWHGVVIPDCYVRRSPRADCL